MDSCGWLGLMARNAYGSLRKAIEIAEDAHIVGTFSSLIVYFNKFIKRGFLYLWWGKFSGWTNNLKHLH